MPGTLCLGARTGKSLGQDTCIRFIHEVQSGGWKLTEVEDEGLRQVVTAPPHHPAQPLNHSQTVGTLIMIGLLRGVQLKVLGTNTYRVNQAVPASNKLHSVSVLRHIT